MEKWGGWLPKKGDRSKREEEKRRADYEKFLVAEQKRTEEQERRELEEYAKAHKKEKQRKEKEGAKRSRKQPDKACSSDAKSVPNPVSAGTGAGVKQLQDPDSFLVKKVRYFERDVSIVLQNRNGACPLLALANVLLLSGAMRIQLPSGQRSISRSVLMEGFGNYLLNKDPKKLPRDLRANYEATVEAALTLLPSFLHGMDINVRFTAGIGGYEYTPEVGMFDLLGVPLVHGWLVDPQDTVTYSAIGRKSFNECLNLIAQDSGPGPMATDRKVEAAKPVESDVVPKKEEADVGGGVGESVRKMESGEFPRKEQVKGEGVVGVGNVATDKTPLKEEAVPSGGVENTEKDLSEANDKFVSELKASDEDSAFSGESKTETKTESGPALEGVIEDEKRSEVHPHVQISHMVKMDVVKSTSQEYARPIGSSEYRHEMASLVREGEGHVLPSKGKQKIEVIEDYDGVTFEDSNRPQLPVPIVEDYPNAQHPKGKGPVSPYHVPIGVSLPIRLPEPAVQSTAIVEIVAVDADAHEALHAQPQPGAPIKQALVEEVGALPKMGNERPAEPTLSTTAPVPSRKGKGKRKLSDDAASREVATSVIDEDRELAVALEQSRLGKPEDDEFVRLAVVDFFASSPTQTTYYGLAQLHEQCVEKRLYVFFANNHYNVMIKVRGELYVLVTDAVMAATSASAIWEKLSDLDGNTVFANGSFQVVGGRLGGEAAMGSSLDPLLAGDLYPDDNDEFHSVPAGKPTQEDEDLMLALHLQNKEREGLKVDQKAHEKFLTQRVAQRDAELMKKYGQADDAPPCCIS